MAKASPVPHLAIAAGFEPNGFAIFKGYASVEEGQETVLEEGWPVRIDRFENDADIVVVAVDDEGNDILDEAGQPKYVERLFPEELEKAELDNGDEPAVEAEPAPAPVAEAKPKRTAKPKAVAEAPAPVVEASPAAEAKPKRSAKAKPAAPAAEAPAAEVKPKRTATAKPKAPAAEAKPVATKIAATPVVEITDAASVREILSELDALAAAKSLVERADQTDYTLGGVLRHIHETGVYKTLGYEGKKGFADYVSTTLGIEYRKARYLINSYTVFALIGADEAKLQAIGWSKAKELARIAPDELKRDFDKLIKLAEGNTRDDLAAKIKKSYKVTTRGDGTTVALTSFSFKLAEAEAETVVEGLKEACISIGEQDNNKALAFIVGEWRGHGTGQDLSLEDTLTLIQAKFGVGKITYVDEDGQEFEFEADEMSDAVAEAAA